MFTGIVQGQAQVRHVAERPGLRRFTLGFAPGFDDDLAIGASVAVNGVCLTVTSRPAPGEATFDAMQQTLAITTLSGVVEGGTVHVERSANASAEIGGHVLSGHIDVQGTVTAVRTPENNRVLRIALPAPWMRYVFAKGYIAVDGASLTVAEAERAPDGSGWFEVWLIPETLRVTHFGGCEVGTHVNIEIERQTQVIVDTVRAAVEERLGPLMPALEALMRQQTSPPKA
jgi:riboflavin synthase